MPDSNEIQAAIGRIPNFNGKQTRGEVKELPNILQDDEELRDVIDGTYNSGNGLLVATDRRLIFIDKGWVSLRVEVFPYENITSIDYSTGMLMGAIVIFAAGNQAKIDNATKALVRPFAENVRLSIASWKEAQRRVVAQPHEDRYGKLEKIHELMEKGILSKEEYELEKRRLLQQ